MGMKQRVECFNLNDLDQKRKYENIINQYQVVREEFAYSKTGEALMTVWYVKEED